MHLRSIYLCHLAQACHVPVEVSSRDVFALHTTSRARKAIPITFPKTLQFLTPKTASTFNGLFSGTDEMEILCPPISVSL